MSYPLWLPRSLKEAVPSPPCRGGINPSEGVSPGEDDQIQDDAYAGNMLASDLPF